jgi:hypothetical protein
MKIFYLLSFIIFGYYTKAQMIEFLPQNVFFFKNDTVYLFEIYESYELIDSIKISDTLVESSDCKCWIFTDIIPTSYYDTNKRKYYFKNDTIKYECKFKENKNSIWLSKYDISVFNMEKEYILIYRKEYLPINSYWSKISGGEVVVFRKYWWGGQTYLPKKNKKQTRIKR